MIVFAIPVLWVLAAMTVAWLGRNRKFGFWGYFFASLFFSPLLALLLLAASDKRRAD